MFMIATRAVHIGVCLVLLSLFAFETSLQHRHSIGEMVERFVAIARMATRRYVCRNNASSFSCVAGSPAPRFYDHVIKRSSCACIRHGCVGTTRTLNP